MKDVAHIILSFSLIVGGLILQLSWIELDTSSWNFTGAPMLIAFTEWLGALLMVVGFGALMIKAIRERS